MGRRSIARAVLALTALALALGGCVGEVAGPRSPDPSPLARCTVAASASSPLVTEWPASQKSRLEALLVRGPVVVAYAGCELRILEGCALPAGTYAFTPTTVATDTLEIASADDLYAKLPLGAAGLEGELGRSGRLAVRTTVSGQFVLSGATAADVPEAGACSGATHLVTRLSVGAFKLLAGGAERAGTGVALAGAKAGVSLRHEEEVLRQAGDPETCAGAAGATQCRSPVQVFLARLAPKGGDEPPAEGAFKVRFHPDEPGQRWSLRGKDDRVLCELPCERWVPPSSGLYAQLDAARADELQRVAVPDAIPYAPGTRLEATPRAARGSTDLATLLALPAVAGLAAATPVLGGVCAGGKYPSTCVALPVVGGASALLLGGALYYRFGYLRTKGSFELGAPPPGSPQAGAGLSLGVGSARVTGAF